MIRRTALRVPLFVTPLFVAAVTASAGELITAGAMEPSLATGLPRGWVRNCWGKNTVAFSAGAPRRGKSSLKVVCTAYETGAAQFYYPLKVAAGKNYRISLWLRADGGVGTVRVGLRHCPKPYTMHLSAEFEPGETWERVTFEKISLNSDDEAGLFIWFKPDGPGTLWVDDVSVIESEPKPLNLPVPDCNVVPNAGFELALERDWRSRHVQPRYDTKKPFEGSRSLRWDLDGQADQLVTRLLEFGGGGETFTLALAARAEGQARIDAQIWPGMLLRWGKPKPLLRLQCRPGVDWQAFRMEGALADSPNGTYYLVLDIHPEGKASVWLDAVRLEPGNGVSPFRPRRRFGASLECSRLAHIHRQGDPVRLDVRASNYSGKSRRAALACRVTDYWRRPVTTVRVSLRVKPGSIGRTTIKLPVRKTGVYLAELLDGRDVLSELSFSVLPKVSAVPAGRSVVGGHFRLDEFHLRVANMMGIKWTRIHDCESITHWRSVEPEKGRFVWFDDKVGLARRHGIRILGEFLRVPKWASSAGRDITGRDVHHYPPRDLNEFAAYVRAVVGHYKGDIRHWEVWNEPYHTGFWRGTPEQYAELARTATRETHAADPKAVLLVPSACPSARVWVERALAAGALEGADVFSYHGYGVFQPKSYQLVQQWAAQGRDHPCPIWNSETGPTSRTFYRHISDKLVNYYTNWLRPLDYDLAAEHAAKLFVLALAGGAERYFQYWCVYEPLLLPRLSAMTIFEYDTALRPMAVSYAVAASKLDGTVGQGWIEMPGPVLANILTDARRTIAVLWRRGGRRPRQIAIPFDPTKLDAHNMMGNPLALKVEGIPAGFVVSVGSEPIYLVAAASHGKALLAALKKARRVR